MKQLLEAKAKAIAGAVVTAVVSYVGLAIIQSQVLTLHGLELAAVSAVLTFLGVHQAPRNKRPKDAGETFPEVLYILTLLAVTAAAITYVVVQATKH